MEVKATSLEGVGHMVIFDVIIIIMMMIMIMARHGLHCL